MMMHRALLLCTRAQRLQGLVCDQTSRRWGGAVAGRLHHTSAVLTMTTTLATTPVHLRRHWRRSPTAPRGAELAGSSNARNLGKGLFPSIHFSSSQNSQAEAVPSKKMVFNRVKELRKATNAPMGDCKAAIKHAMEQHQGMLYPLEHVPFAQDALEFLRKRGVAAASSKMGRTATQGVVAASISTKQSAEGAGALRTAALVQVNCETDFVARNDNFLHGAASIALAALSLAGTARHTVLDANLLGKAHVNSSRISENTTAGAAAKVETVDDVIVGLGSTLREKVQLGKASAVTCPDRRGVIATYIHQPLQQLQQEQADVAVEMGFSGAMVTLQLPESSPSSVKLSEDDTNLLHEIGTCIAMHMVVARPEYMFVQDVPKDVVERELALQREMAQSEGKPEKVMEKVVQGRMKAFYKENVLFEQEMLVPAPEAIANTIKGKNPSVRAVIDAFPVEGVELVRATLLQCGA